MQLVSVAEEAGLILPGRRIFARYGSIPSCLYWGARWLTGKLKGLQVQASAKALRFGLKQILD